MAGESDAIEQIAFLTRAEARVRILTHLLETGSATRREFRDRLNQSRSTVSRSLSTLLAQGYVYRDGDQHSLTPRGRILAEGLGDLVDIVQATDELSTFIEWFPYSEHDLTVDDLRDSEITASTEPDPYAPSRKHAETLHEVASHRMLLPSIDLQIIEGTHDRVLDGDLELEILLSPAMEETVASDPFAPVLREQIEAGGLTVFVCEEQAPFYLGLNEDLVQIGVEDDEGFPRALLETDRESVREWAEEVYARYREQAREKPAEQF